MKEKRTKNSDKGRNQEFVTKRTKGQKCRVCKKVKPLEEFSDVGSRRCRPCDNKRRAARLKKARGLAKETA